MTDRLQYTAKRQLKYVLFGILFMQCSGNNDTAINKYFGLQNFIDQQISLLETRDIQLKKTLQFDENTETQTLSRLDQTQWEKEFKIFREHDINRPFLIDAYATSEGVNTEGENFKEHALLDSTQTGILDMKIVYDQGGQVTNWESSFKEENLLYSNYRSMSATADQQGMLAGYEIKGYHKLMFKDTVYYQILVEIDIID